MHSLARSVVAGISFFLLSTAARAEPCASTSDCKGQRVCRQGACVPPTACGRDRDCPGEEICKARACVLPTAEDLGQAPAPAAAPPPPARTPAPAARPVMGTSRAPAAAPPPAPPPAPPEPVYSPPPAPAPRPAARPAPQAACGTDRDCPGDLVCQDGRCVSPGGGSSASAAPPAPAAAPEPMACTRDKDCPGDQVCTDRRCGLEGGRPAASPARVSGGARFSVSGPIVNDAQLHLSWQKGFSTPLEQVDGAQYCRDLQLAGGGWRLPTVEELGSFLGQDLKASVAQSFDPVREWFWTSTDGERMKSWAVYLWANTKQQRSKREKGVARCVRRQ